jgi:hypothetical protein
LVVLDTFRTLREHDHKLAAYCARCERWVVLDLERLIAEGRVASRAAAIAVGS